MSCDFTEHLVVCDISDSSLAASFGVDLGEIRQRIGNRQTRAQRRAERRQEAIMRMNRRAQLRAQRTAMQAMREAGMTFAAIGKAFGLTRQAVQINLKRPKGEPTPEPQG